MLIDHGVNLLVFSLIIECVFEYGACNTLDVGHLERLLECLEIVRGVEEWLVTLFDHHFLVMLHLHPLYRLLHFPVELPLVVFFVDAGNECIHVDIELLLTLRSISSIMSIQKFLRAFLLFLSLLCLAFAFSLT